jgi:hypothetical protein
MGGGPQSPALLNAVWQVELRLLGGDNVFRWNVRLIHGLVAVGALAAFVIGSGADWVWC